MANAGLEVSAARKASRELQGAALLSVCSNSLLTVGKLVVGFLTGSISVVAEGIHSGNDLLASFIAWFAVRRGTRPPDEDHGFGHGKYESLSAAIEAGLIVLAALGIVWVALGRILSGEDVEMLHGPALFVMGLSVGLNLLVSSHLFRVAHRHDSVAMEANGWHLRTDVWTSAGVFIGLIIVRLTGLHIIDAITAIAVALMILLQGGRIGHKALQQLLDHSLPPAEQEAIKALLREHSDLFMDYHRLRSRKAGRERHVDLHLVTCPSITVAQAHAVCDHLERDIAALLGNTRVTIHVEPCERDDCAGPGTESDSCGRCGGNGANTDTTPEK